jgi:hypothetical protein
VVGNKELADLISQCRDPALGDLSPADEERVERFAQNHLTVFAGIEGAYRNDEMPKAQYETFCAEFHRIVETYPSFVPRMRSILSRLGSIPENYLVFKPLFE